MGCVGSSHSNRGVKLRKPRPWRHSSDLTHVELINMREEFWDTSHYYGGSSEIWHALRAAAEVLESDIAFAQSIINTAGIIVRSSDMTVCYDERGALYRLPKYVVSTPSNMLNL